MGERGEPIATALTYSKNDLHTTFLGRVQLVPLGEIQIRSIRVLLLVTRSVRYLKIFSP